MSSKDLLLALCTALLLSCFMATACGQEYCAVGGSLGLRINFCPEDIGIDYEGPDSLFRKCSFDTMYRQLAFAISDSAAPSVPMWFALVLLEQPSDLVLLSSHGDCSQGLAVEGYSDRVSRNAVVDDYLASGEYAVEEIGFIDAFPYYYITAKPSLLEQHSPCNARSIIMVAASNSDSFHDVWGAGAHIGYDYSPQSDHAKEHISRVFCRLRGLGGRTTRSSGEVISGLPVTQRGRTDLVINPAVESVYPDQGHTFTSWEYHTAWIEFDTAVEIVGDIEDVVTTGITQDESGNTFPCAYIRNLTLAGGGTRIDFEIKPNVRGAFPVWVDWAGIVGQGTTDRYLNGNTIPPGPGQFNEGENARPPDRDDYVIAWDSTVGQDPAASLLSIDPVVNADGVDVRWVTVSEKGTDSFTVCRSSDGLEWVPVSPPFKHRGSTGVGASYEWHDPDGRAGDLYRIRETETSGSQLWMWGERATRRVDVPERRADVVGHLVAPLDRRACAATRRADTPERPAEGDPALPATPPGLPRAPNTPPDGGTALVITRNIWRTNLQPLLDHWLSSRGLASISILDIEDLGPDPTDVDIKTAVSGFADTSALDYILLVGDASRTRPERDIIPSHYVFFDGCHFDPDSLFAWDGWYGDLDDDGLEDAAVGRFPAEDAGHVDVQVAKSIDYDAMWDHLWRAEALTVVYDSDVGRCEGEWAWDLAEAVTQQLPSTFFARVLRGSIDPWSYEYREQLLLDRWNSGVHLVYASGTVATAVLFVNFFSKPKGFSVDQLVENNCYPVVLGASCGLGGFQRDPPPFEDDLATDFQRAAGKGSIAWLAFNENTEQWYDYVVAREFVERIDKDGTLSLGQIWLEVKDSVLSEYPGALPYVQMWTFLGDPTVRMTWCDTSPSVSENLTTEATALLHPYPNPFNPTTTLTYSLSTLSDVALEVFSVSGRLVMVLEDGVVSAGRHEVRWDGTDSDGNAVSSGIYFVRFEAGGKIDTRKLVLLR